MKSKIRRNHEKCNLCMRCVQDCASGVWKKIAGMPAMTDPELCNQCSHCLAVCPKNAIENDYLKPAKVRRVKRKQIDPDVYKEIALSRRSIRHFTDDPVDPDTVKKIIEVARFSPTASNSQHVSYIVITDPEVLKEISEMVFDLAVSFYKYSTTRSGQFIFKGLKMSAAVEAMLEKYIEPMAYYIELKDAGRDLILHHAPVLMLLHGPGMSFFGADNCNIAAANITNYAHSLGLGSCYIGFVTILSRISKKLCRLVNLPKSRKVYASVVLGHPSIKHTNIVSRIQPEITWVDGK